MISNNEVLEDKSYPKEESNTLIRDSKVMEVLMQSDLPLGLRNNAKKCTVTS